jgi:hypothetical protein
MSKRLIAPALLAALLSFPGHAQTTDPNPAHSPDVFLDNHRPPNQKKGKEPTTRNVSGKVTDENGQPLEGALVTLTDTKSNAKTTFFTKKDGHYSFGDLSFNIDYQLQAKYKNQVSESRKLSQYDHTVNVVRILQVGSLDDNGGTAEARDKGPKK